MNTYTIATEDHREHSNFWLSLFQTMLNITDREKSVLVEILVRRQNLLDENVPLDWVKKLLFDADSRKIYCSALSISTFNLTNILLKLVEKDVLDKVDHGYLVDDRLIPQDRLEFKFVR